MSFKPQLISNFTNQSTPWSLTKINFSTSDTCKILNEDFKHYIEVFKQTLEFFNLFEVRFALLERAESQILKFG